MLDPFNAERAHPHSTEEQMNKELPISIGRIFYFIN